MDYTWKVHDDPFGSDHFPIILEITQPIHDNNRHPYWETNKADWQQFKTLCNRRLVQDPNSTVLINHFTETLIAIANETIPKASHSNRRNKPLFNNECKIAIRIRNAALRKFKKEPLTFNLNSFKLLKAKARKTIKQAKKISWQNYVNKLNLSTKTNTVWKTIRKISEKNQSTPLKRLINNNTQVTNIKDITDTFTEIFSANSSSTISDLEFHKYKDKKEKQKLNFKSGNTDIYNKLFSLSELKEAIQKTLTTAVGPDEIHYKFLRHHHHIVLAARISLTLSRHSSLSFIALGRSSGQQPVSSHGCWMYVRAGHPAFARPCVGIHKSTSLMSSKFLRQLLSKSL